MKITDVRVVETAGQCGEEYNYFFVALKFGDEDMFAVTKTARHEDARDLASMPKEERLLLSPLVYMAGPSVQYCGYDTREQAESGMASFMQEHELEIEGTFRSRNVPVLV